MFEVSIKTKRDAVVKFFKIRQALECEALDNDDKFTLKLMRWKNVALTYRIKSTTDLPRFFSYTKNDLADVDVLLFMCETLAWRQTYAVRCDELAKHLDADGNGKIDMDELPCDSYFFYDMVKAIQWLI